MSSNVVDPTARDKYRLRVTAGPSYDPNTHTLIPVNSSTPTVIDTPHLTLHLHIRIKSYNGLPASSPATSPYFQHPNHLNDRYSIAYSFVPKRDIPGQDLVFGFDFDHPIRDRLPPGFRYAMRIVTGWLDPGIWADAYAEEPFLYGPALSSWFALWVGERDEVVPVSEQLEEFERERENVVEEGGSPSGSGDRIRREMGVPSKVSKRRKFFLDKKKLESWTFERGRLYQADFFNPYLDFGDFALRLPGFRISVVKYIDEKTHQLRYVLRDWGRGEVLLCVVFELLFGEKLRRVLKEGGGQVGDESKAQAESDERQEQEKSTQGSRIEDGREHESSSATPTPSDEQSRSPPTPNEEVGHDGDGQNESSAAAATNSLVSSISSGLAALGFGRRASGSSSSSAESKTSLAERTRTKRNEGIDAMDDKTVEKFLQARSSGS